jgi:hypothetical protein
MCARPSRPNVAWPRDASEPGPAQRVCERHERAGAWAGGRSANRAGVRQIVRPAACVVRKRARVRCTCVRSVKRCSNSKTLWTPSPSPCSILPGSTSSSVFDTRWLAKAWMSGASSVTLLRAPEPSEPLLSVRAMAVRRGLPPPRRAASRRGVGDSCAIREFDSGCF